MTIKPDPDYDWNATPGRVPTPTDPLDPATRLVDQLGREWAVTTSGTWGALGHDVTADNYTQLAAKYGPVEVLG